MIHPPREQMMRRWKQLQRALPAHFFDFCCSLAGCLVQVVKLLPRRRLDDRERDLTERNRGLKRADAAAVFVSGTRTLFWHGLSTFDHGMIGLMHLNPGADRERVNSLFRADSNHWNVDRVEQLRRRVVDDVDDGAAAMDSPVYAENPHLTAPMKCD